LARAAVIISAKSAIRCSVPSGNALGLVLDAMTAPQSRPATVIGAPAADRIPYERIIAASSPGTLL
jgi:hypothetical protein